MYKRILIGIWETQVEAFVGTDPKAHSRLVHFIVFKFYLKGRRKERTVK